MGSAPVQATLRAAFDAAMRDPELLSEAAKLKLDLDPTPGAEVERIVAGLYRTPADVVAEVSKIMRPVQK